MEMISWANDVEVASICSFINSGTELKMFSESFDEAQLDGSSVPRYLGKGK